MADNLILWTKYIEMDYLSKLSKEVRKNQY